MGHTESFVLTGMRGRWISHTERPLIYKQTWPNERKKIVKKQNKRQLKRALREAIFTVLGVLWTQQWKDESSDHFETLEDAGELPKVSRKNGDHLALLRAKNDDGKPDFRRNPERAYDYIQHGLDARIWSRRFLGFSIICFVFAVILNVLSKEDTTDVPYAMDIISIGCGAIGILSLITYIMSRLEERVYQISEAANFVGQAWEKTRKEYVKVGLIEAALKMLLENKADAQEILNAQTLPEQIRAGEILRNIFLEHFAQVGVPYVKAHESSTHATPQQAEKTEADFNLMASLVPYMRFTGHPGEIRTSAHRVARRRVQDANGGAPTEVLNLLRFPGPGEMRSVTKDTPPGDPGPPPAA